MLNPEDILSKDDYSNYRNIRAVSTLFIIFGVVLVLGGIGILVDKDAKPEEKIHPAIAAALAIAGLAGAIGGIAAQNGSRRWAPLVYVMAAVYMFGFPVGTILSIVMFRGLSRYLKSVQQLRTPVTIQKMHESP